MKASPFTNRLIHETSPYLKQHAHNPVDWYPWGPEALERSRSLARPIFLSVGYSACHWCHVMEHESFEDPDVAAILNQHFISIKVDREERPDLDQIYMSAVQRMTGQGGWPMSMFLTPDLKPFYGGTYFPPDERYGRPSFKGLLNALVDAWLNRRQEITEISDRVVEQLRVDLHLESAHGALDDRLLRNIPVLLRRAFDPVNGGFGSAPKFPHAMELRLLLRCWKRFDDEDALHMVRLTLDRMAMGGMYDHLGGGFHRYSTDARWLVPHFEKMLYDNALLTPAYLEGFQATGDPFYREVVEQTLAYVRREMTSPEGPFYSTQDADSEGVEGKFFVWSAEEIKSALDEDSAKLFEDVYEITSEGNWEEKNILNRSKNYAQSAGLLRIAEPELLRRLAQSRQVLYEIRSRRVWPGRDEKILTAWNGLMINAFAQAAQVLDEPTYAETAGQAARFILQRMRRPDGRLMRTYCAGSEPKLNGYLEDFSYFIDALVSLYEATFDVHWIESALDLTRVMIDQFWDDAEGGFFYTGRDHEALIARTKDPHDSSVPSANSMAVTALLRLSQLTGRAELRQKAEKTLQMFHGVMAGSPLAGGQMLIALDFLLGPVQEYAVIGDPENNEVRRVLRAIRGGYRPNKVVAMSGEPETIAAAVPLLANKSNRGSVTTFVCQNHTCKEPLVGAAAVESALR